MKHRIDDRRKTAKHRVRGDEGRGWTRFGEKGRNTAMKDERNWVGEQQREQKKQGEGKIESSRDQYRIERSVAKVSRVL